MGQTDPPEMIEAELLVPDDELALENMSTAELQALTGHEYRYRGVEGNATASRSFTLATECTSRTYWRAPRPVPDISRGNVASRRSLEN